MDCRLQKLLLNNNLKFDFDTGTDIAKQDVIKATSSESPVTGAQE